MFLTYLLFTRLSSYNLLFLIIYYFVYLGSSIASLRLVVALVKFQESLLDCLQEIGITPSTKVGYLSCLCLQYGSETWTLSNVQENKIKTKKQQCLRRILKIRWQQEIPTKKCWDVLVSPLCILPSARAGLVLLWGWPYPKDLLYIELVIGKRNIGQPRLRYKDVRKGDLKIIQYVIVKYS